MIKYFDILSYQKLKKLENTTGLSDQNEKKLSNFIINVSDQIHYSSKTDYNLLLNKYLKKEILPYEFRFKFLKLRNQNSEKTALFFKNFQALENLVLSKQSEKFGLLVSKISDLCIGFDISWNDCESDLMSETEFYFLVKSYSSELLQEQQHLVYESFKFLLFVVVLALLLLFSSK